MSSCMYAFSKGQSLEVKKLGKHKNENRVCSQNFNPESGMSLFVIISGRGLLCAL
jgi:hypothetical protein